MAHARINLLGQQPGKGRKSGASKKRRKDGQPLGRLLIEAGALTEEALDAALAAQRQTFLPLGRILRDEYGVEEAAVAEALRKQGHLPRVFLRFFPIDGKAIRILPLEYCQEKEVVAFENLGDLLCVACANPTRKDLEQELAELTKLEVRLYRAPWEDIRRKLDLSV
ncbi:MAG: hypothetical protein AMXMBFR7_24780 [Planctomycetota bacterium]|nr:hypothetical protein [Planctomycetota bacterium]